VPNLFKHLAQLAVAPFNQHHLIPGIVALPYLANARRRCPHHARARLAPLDGDAPAQNVQFRFGRLPAHFHQVGLLHSRRGLGQLVGKLAVVGHQQKPLAHVIQPAHGIEPLAHLLKKLHHRRTAFGILYRGHEALRLVEHKVALTLGALQQLSVHADVVAPRIGLRAQFGHNLAVDLHASLFDQLFGATPAGNAGLRKDLLQPLQLCGKPLPGT
jgi:hypothetical protein